MDKSARRAAKAAFAKQKVEAGIYAVECKSTGECWVGKSRNLASVRNRLVVSVRNDPVINAELRRCWEKFGNDVMEVRVLDVIPQETLPAFIASALKEKLEHWRGVLGAALV